MNIIILYEFRNFKDEYIYNMNKVYFYESLNTINIHIYICIYMYI